MLNRFKDPNSPFPYMYADCDKCGHKVVYDKEVREFTCEKTFKYSERKFTICGPCFKAHFDFLD